MKDKSKLIAALLAIAAVIVVCLSIFNKGNDNQGKVKPLIVDNYSDFYTVNSCIYRTITYISDKSIEDLLLVISDKYKKENKVTEENVLDFLPKVGQASTFVSKKMYYEYLKNGLEKYYVYGKIESDDMNGTGSAFDSYFIVYLDRNSNLFSLEPYNGDIFAGGD